MPKKPIRTGYVNCGTGPMSSFAWKTGINRGSIVGTHFPRIIITSGEPAGIGLDLCCALARQPFDAALVVIADQAALLERANALGMALHIQPYVENAVLQPHPGNGTLTVLHQPTGTSVTAGQLDPANSAYVLGTLTAAIQQCPDGAFDGMVTCPVHKGVKIGREHV